MVLQDAGWWETKQKDDIKKFFIFNKYATDQNNGKKLTLQHCFHVKKKGS